MHVALFYLYIETEMPCCSFVGGIGIPDEIVAVASLALIMFLARLALDKTLFDSLANALSIKRPSIVIKFKENAFNTLYYTLSMTVGYMALIKTGWLNVPLFTSFGHDQDEVLASLNYDWASNWSLVYYIMSASYYAQAMVASLTIDGYKSDKWVMVLHHFITLCLVTLSGYNGGFRLGLFVILLHDISDVFLYTAKCLKYARSKWDQYLFVCFAVSFYLLRLVAFPIIISSCVFEWQRLHGLFMGCNFWDIFCWQRLTTDDPSFAIGDFYYVVFGVPLTYYGTMILMLIVLMLVHCWWGSLIWMMIYQKMSTGHVEKDVRSDDEDEDDKEQTRKEKRKKDK